MIKRGSGVLGACGVVMSFELTFKGGRFENIFLSYVGNETSSSFFGSFVNHAASFFSKYSFSALSMGP